MTTYGTIPTTYGTIPTSLSDLDIIAKGRERIISTIGEQRPWPEMLQLQSLSLPASFNESTERIKTNVAYFRGNYASIIIITLLLTLVWHPFYLIAFITIIVAWCFLYLLRDDPLIIFGLEICDRLVMVFLLGATFLFLFHTDVSDNIIVALFIGLLVILVHSSLRNSDDVVILDDEERYGSIASLNAGEKAENVPLRNAASTSFTAS